MAFMLRVCTSKMEFILKIILLFMVMLLYLKKPRYRISSTLVMIANHCSKIYNLVSLQCIIKYFVGITNSYAKQVASNFFNIITVAHLCVNFSQLSMFSLSTQRRAHRVVIQVTGVFCGGSAANPGGKEDR